MGNLQVKRMYSWGKKRRKGKQINRKINKESISEGPNCDNIFIACSYTWHMFVGSTGWRGGIYKQLCLGCASHM